jgi:capsid assembly protease
MPNKLLRFSAQVFNTPQLILPQDFKVITDYLHSRNNALLGDTIYQGTPGQGLATEELAIFNGVGVLQISGPLTYKPVEMMCAPEATSYLDLIEDVQEMIDAGVKAIIFECSSGGGQASHLFSTADAIRSLLTEAGVDSFSYIDEVSASACYGLACIADEVIIHPEAQAGSIGAVIALCDESKADEMAGIKPVYVTSSPGKIPFAADGSFKESFLNKLQEDVTKLGDKFVAHVSKYTGISTEDIKAMDAQMFDAETCLSNGLVNSIMTHEQFSSYIAGKYN